MRPRDRVGRRLPSRTHAHVPTRTLADRLRAPGAVFLDAPRPDADTGRTGALLFDAPRRVLEARTLGEVEGVLRAVDGALADGHHVAGVLAYEAGLAFEPAHLAGAPLPAAGTAADVPLAWFGVYDLPESVDAAAALAGLPAPTVRDVAFGWTADDYAARLATVRDHIREGDVYQVNLTLPVTFGLDGDPLALYAALRARQPTSYGAWLSLPGGLAVASVSPELFVRVDPVGEGARVAVTRPMKGTAPRGATPAEDDRLATALVAADKERAENLMIVDLLRNDLARVAEGGSVSVPALFDAERYDTVTQMTSTVRARLRADVALSDLLRATFPCGSVTGAPKLRAMEIIAAVERAPRGVYCGAVGYAAPDGTAAFSVAIRTAVVRDGRGVYGVGSGVVWDSRADSEWAECALKARVLTDLAAAPDAR